MNSLPKREIADSIIKRDYFKERELSEYAFKSINANRYDQLREKIPDRENIRPVFSHDTDRIIHSLSYSRYIDKTQVFYLIENDHISHRVLHVQLVAKIAKTIGRFLNLNEDLIEAISLGHDVGHTPFGHNGETIISDFCKENNEGCFMHNVQSFRLFHEIENHGKGNNLTVQVLDGIISHNGEILNERYVNDKNKTADQLVNEYKNSLLDKKASSKMISMTLEGCVMRISDVIAYVGRDIEDAIIVNLISREQIPIAITSTIGNTNADIINSLIIDILNNSFEQGAIIFSKEVFEALQALKDWNNENIYSNTIKMKQDDKIRKMFNEILDINLNYLLKNDEKQHIWKWTNSTMNEQYKEKTSPARIVADYVSGMTDNFIMKEYENIVIPKSFGYSFKNNFTKRDE
jgi:dGTPase